MFKTKELSKFISFLFLISSMLLSILVCGCGGKTATHDNSGKTDTSYTVTDSQGTKIRIPKKPMRIIAQSMTFDTLLLGVVPPERLVACNILCQKADSSFVVEETKNIPVKLTMFNYIPTDTVLKLKPDIIVLPGTAKPEMIHTFRDLGFPVFPVVLGLLFFSTAFFLFLPDAFFPPEVFFFRGDLGALPLLPIVSCLSNVFKAF